MDEKTIALGDMGGLIDALEKIVQEQHQSDWTDRMLFLKKKSGKP